MGLGYFVALRDVEVATLSKIMWKLISPVDLEFFFHPKRSLGCHHFCKAPRPKRSEFRCRWIAHSGIRRWGINCAWLSMSEPLEERAWKCSWDCIFWLLRSESFPHLSTIGLTVVTSLIILQSDCKVIFHLDLDEDFWALLSKMLWVHIGSSWGICCACLSADKVNCSRQLFSLRLWSYDRL